MLTPIKTEMCNVDLAKPLNWDKRKDGECQTLPVYFDVDGNFFISTWELSDLEREKIANGANITLTVFSGIHPPVAVNVV